MFQRTDYPFLSVEDLLNIQDNPDRWIIPHMIPRVGRTIVYGKGGSYKSAVVFDIAVSIASSGKLLERIPVESYGPVAVISTEGSIYTNRDRLLGHMRSRNVHPSNACIRLFYSHQRTRLDKSESLRALESSLERIRPIVLVLDPFINFFSGNENNANEVNAFTEVVDYLVDKYNLSVIVIHHANKKGDLRGSSAIWGWADSILYFQAKRRVRVPGVSREIDILTIEGEKQRDGIEGHLLSVVPFISTDPGMVTFGFYSDANPLGVIMAFMKQEVYKLLRESNQVMTRNTIAQALGTTHERVTDAVDWLIRDGFVEQVEMRVATDKQGARTRAAEGIRIVTGGSRVDTAGAMIRVMHRTSPEEQVA